MRRGPPLPRPNSARPRVHQRPARRHVAPALEHRRHPGRRHRAVEDARPRGAHHRRDRRSGQLAGGADVVELRRRRHQPLVAHDVRGVPEVADPRQRRLDRAAVGGRQPAGGMFHAHPRAPQPRLLEDAAQLARGVCALGIGPDADVVVERGVLGLAQVGTAGQQHQWPAVGGDDAALEDHMAGGVVTRQAGVAFLRDDEQRGQAPAVQRGPRRGQPRGRLRGRQAQRNGAAARGDGGDLGHAATSQMSHIVRR